ARVTNPLVLGLDVGGETAHFRVAGPAHFALVPFPAMRRVRMPFEMVLLRVARPTARALVADAQVHGLHVPVEDCHRRERLPALLAHGSLLLDLVVHVQRFESRRSTVVQGRTDATSA